MPLLPTNVTRSHDSLCALLALANICGLRPAVVARLVERFGSAPAVFAAPKAELDRLGIGEKTRAAILCRQPLVAAQRELDRCRRLGVTALAWDDSRYPDLLRQIAGPPPVLFVRGSLELLRQPAVAVVGCRTASSYGLRVAHRYGRELAEAGCVVTSGLALGIDGAAHEGCLAGKGAPVAVLACGVDLPYPRLHRRLYEQILDQGAVVSEYLPGTPPARFRFPARNRIISGLSLGVVVVEAGRRSGALITARFALDQGREVFAVPGQVDAPSSQGCHRLVQEGAKLAATVTDILEELPNWAWEGGKTVAAAKSADRPENPAPALAGEAQIVYSCLDVYPQDIDTLIQRTGLSAGRVAELLVVLELDGLIESLPGNQYRVRTHG